MKLDVFENPAARAADGLADIRIRNEAGQEVQLDLPFRDLYRRCGLPSQTALDLLLVAGCCYVIDKTVARSVASTDGWTRTLEVSMPVSDPTLWVAAEDLSKALTFLTGDTWHLSFTQREQPAFIAPAKEPTPMFEAAEAVCLFSGGLDSLAGAIDLLSDAAPQRVLLVGHYDSPGPRKVQTALASKLVAWRPKRVKDLHVRVAHRPAEAAEESLRSRSFVFVALGIYAAQAFGPQTPLYMFENGLIALNVPLTPSRSGSCSTRTMHPYYLARVADVIARLGIQNPISNPYALKTKGECVAQCKDQATLAQLAAVSVSCSHGSRRQDWVRKQATNCGYCVPCLFRRAALHAIGLDDSLQYGIDVKSGELSIEDELESANDLRAVVDFLRGPLSAASLRKKLIATAQVPNLDQYVALAFRGFAEVELWLGATKTSGQASGD